MEGISRRDFLKTLWIATGAVAIAWTWIYTIFKNPENINSNNKLFDVEPHDYRDSDLPWFDNEYQISEKTTTPSWNTIIKDCGLDFYVAQPEDKTRSIILEKIKKDYPYIKDERYQKPVYWLNITADSLVGDIQYKWKTVKRNASGVFYIPLPIQIEKRQVEYEQMGEYTLQWVQRLQKSLEENPTINYNGERINLKERLEERLNTISPIRLATFISAFSRSESAGVQDFSDNSDPEKRKQFDPIGTLDLSRYEKWYNSFSYTYMHLFMEPWFEWYEAMKLLSLTEWQANHPVNSIQLFLIYCMIKKRNWRKLYNLISDENIYFTDISVARNGSWQAANQYENKLRNNFKFLWGDWKDKEWRIMWLWWKHKDWKKST